MRDGIAWLLEDLDDKRFYEYLNEKKLELQRLQGEIDTIAPIIKAMEFEAEMRRIAGGFEELKAFRAGLKLRKLEKNNAPNVDPHLIVHVLLHGLPLCGFTKAPPAEWPTHHRWVSLEEDGVSAPGIPCPECWQKKAQASNAQVFFLNEAHELPRITKYQSRKLREGSKFKRELTELENKFHAHTPKEEKRMRFLREEIRKCDVAAARKKK